MDMDDLKNVADIFHQASPETQAHMRPAIDDTHEVLKTEFPAMFESDRAAVAFFIARLLEAFKSEPLCEAFEVLNHTTNSYLLAAAELTLGPLG
jgi:hypothetical protein